MELVVRFLDFSPCDCSSQLLMLFAVANCCQLGSGGQPEHERSWKPRWPVAAVAGCHFPWNAEYVEAKTGKRQGDSH